MENKNQFTPIPDEELDSITAGAKASPFVHLALPKYQVDQQVAVTPEGGNWTYPQPGVVLEVKLKPNGWYYRVRRVLIGAVDTYPESALVPIEEALNYMP